MWHILFYHASMGCPAANTKSLESHHVCYATSVRLVAHSHTRVSRRKVHRM